MRYAPPVFPRFQMEIHGLSAEVQKSLNERRTTLNEAAEITFESLLHPSIRPNHDGNHIAVSAGLVQQFLAQIHPAFFVCDALSFPLSEKFHTRIASADGVHDGNLHVHVPRFKRDRAS
jgi:hypothetical protein